MVRRFLFSLVASNSLRSAPKHAKVVSSRKHIGRINSRRMPTRRILPNHGSPFAYEDYSSPFDVDDDDSYSEPISRQIKLRPKEIASSLDQYVVGQWEAKKALANIIYEHGKRVENNVQLNRKLVYDFFALNSRVPSTSLVVSNSESVRLDKSNALLLGPSGVGKTYLTEIAAKLLDVPIAFANCTTLTRAGYVGDDVESVLQKLLENAKGSAEKAQRGIVFLDEIDKIASTFAPSSDKQRDVAGRDVQQALLKMIEGTIVEVKSDKKPLNGHSKTVQIDTREILFVASGAFLNLDKIVGRRLDKRALGFGAQTHSYSVNDDDRDPAVIKEKRNKLLFEAKPEDLIEFGMIHELVGRFPILVPFHTLNKMMLTDILTKPKNSLVSQQKKYFELDGVDLVFADDALDEISQAALESDTGARALRSIVEKVLSDHKFEAPGSNKKRINISGSDVLHSLKK